MQNSSQSIQHFCPTNLDQRSRQLFQYEGNQPLFICKQELSEPMRENSYSSESCMIRAPSEFKLDQSHQDYNAGAAPADLQLYQDSQSQVDLQAQQMTASNLSEFKELTNSWEQKFFDPLIQEDQCQITSLPQMGIQCCTYPQNGLFSLSPECNRQFAFAASPFSPLLIQQCNLMPSQSSQQSILVSDKISDSKIQFTVDDGMLNTNQDLPNFEQETKNEGSSQNSQLNFRQAFVQPHLNLSKKFSLFDKGTVFDKFQNLKTPDAVQLKLNGNNISTPLNQEDKWTNASSNHRPSFKKEQRKEKISFTCEPSKMQSLNSSRNQSFKPETLRARKLMFDEKSEHQASGMLTSKNDKTIESIAWPEFNNEIQRITVDATQPGTKDLKSGFAVQGKIPTASKHAQKFESIRNTRSIKASNKQIHARNQKSILNTIKESSISIKKLPKSADQKKKVKHLVIKKKATSERKRYYKQLDFVYPRTCFRLMDEYYKETFHESLKEFIQNREHLQTLRSTSQIDKASMMEALEAYLTETFPSEFMSILSGEQKVKMIHAMMAFCFSHRYEKDDLYITETKQDGIIDFSIVRNVMYKYSKKSQETFFLNLFETYFFLMFATSDKYHEQMAKKKDITASKKERLDQENQALIRNGQKALNHLIKDTPELGQIMLQNLQEN